MKKSFYINRIKNSKITNDCVKLSCYLNRGSFEYNYSVLELIELRNQIQNFINSNGGIYEFVDENTTDIKYIYITDGFSVSINIGDYYIDKSDYIPKIKQCKNEGDYNRINCSYYEEYMTTFKLLQTNNPNYNLDIEK